MREGRLDGKLAGDPGRSVGGHRHRWLTLGSFASLLGLWFLLTGVGGLMEPLVKPLSLPSPGAVWRSVVQLQSSGYQGYSLLQHVVTSLARFFAGLVASVLVGVPLGIAMGMNRSFRAVLDPVIEITRPIPKLALLPLLIVWFGIGETAKFVVIVSALLPIMSISAMQGVMQISRQKILAARSLGAGKATVFRRILIPSSLPSIFVGLRVCVGVGITMLVGAELIATNRGIAFMTISATDFLQTDVVFVGVLIMAFVGYSLDLCTRVVEHRVVHWSGRD